MIILHLYIRVYMKKSAVNRTFLIVVHGSFFAILNDCKGLVQRITKGRHRDLQMQFRLQGFTS